MKVSTFLPTIKTDSKVDVRKAKEPVASTNTEPKSFMTDTVELSESSKIAQKEVLKMRGILEDTPEIRQDRVQELKAQINKGEYEINPYKVADKLLVSLLSDNVS
jgi:negative regulator of flagellin synthesis FlgM